MGSEHGPTAEAIEISETLPRRRILAYTLKVVEASHEVILEEIYHFHVKPAQGFGYIWTYTAPDDPEAFSTVFVIEDGDTVLLPKGYHPVVAAAGYQLNYSWALAGEVRSYGPWSEDPRHTWLKNQ